MSWVPVDACTLPTAEQPLRVAEFDDLFAHTLRRVVRPAPTSAVLELAGGDEVESLAAHLAAQETSCCSFFRFDLERFPANRMTMRITVPSEHADVLDGLVGRARAHLA